MNNEFYVIVNGKEEYREQMVNDDLFAYAVDKLIHMDHMPTPDEYVALISKLCRKARPK